MEKNLNNTEAIKKLKKLVEDVRVCMFVNKSEEADARPMWVIQVEDDGNIWFFTKDDKPVAVNADNNNTCLYFSHPDKQIYVSLQGSSDIVKDKQKMEQLWSPMLKAWFPNGLEEPNIALLKITPSEARYWDVDAAKLVILFATIKAAVTGKVTDMGEHGDLKIN